MPSTMNRPIPRLESVHIEGFRSLNDVTLRPGPGVTVLIGPNGAGKSNIIRFFDMLREMLRSRSLRDFVADQGGAGDQLFRGSKRTPRMKSEIAIRTDQGLNQYAFTLTRSHPDRFRFTDESYRFSGTVGEKDPPWSHLSSGHDEARIVEAAQSSDHDGNRETARVITHLLRNITSYQFHDTSRDSGFKRLWSVRGSHRLRSDGGNLAAVLYRMQSEDARRYDEICSQIGWILPVFVRFEIEEERGQVFLQWRARNSDKIIRAHLTSDGSLRFFALMTLLNLPSEELPNVILLDEPELGLHPTAIAVVAGMIRSIATTRQIVLATQSPLLVDEFDLDEIHVLDLKDGHTHLRTLDSARYEGWLDDYSTGELWRKNLLGGRP